MTAQELREELHVLRSNSGRVHELKTVPLFFQHVAEGWKTFEVRNNDRDFRLGDELLLREWNPQLKEYTGNELRRVVCYVTDFRQRTGYVVLGIVDADTIDRLAALQELHADFLKAHAFGCCERRAERAEAEVARLQEAKHGWLVARKRDTGPWEAWAFDRYDEAALFFDAAAQQWSTVYFCRVVCCEGYPLDITPVISGFKQRAEQAEATLAAVRETLDELLGDLAEAHASDCPALDAGYCNCGVSETETMAKKARAQCDGPETQA